MRTVLVFLDLWQRFGMAVDALLDDKLRPGGELNGELVVGFCRGGISLSSY